MNDPGARHDRPGAEDAILPRVGLPSLFGAFFLVSATTLGGGLAMVPVINRAIAKRGWLPEDECMLIFTRTSALPGPIALNMSLLVGQRLRGWKGALSSALGMILPPFAAIVAVMLFMGGIVDSPVAKDFFAGAYATVPGLALALIFRMLRSPKYGKAALPFAAALAALLWFFSSWTLPIFFGGVALWYLLGRPWKS